MDRNERTPARARTWAAAALIVLCALAAYANSFSVPFGGLDDKESIRDNPHIRRLWPPSEPLSLPLWSVARAKDSDDKRAAVARRPVLSLSFALTYAFCGLDPRGYHAVNLAIHVAAALLLFGIVRRTLTGRFGFTPARTDGTALAAALIWLLHPLQTESVTYIIQRGECLVGFLLLATLYCAIRSFDSVHRARWEACAIAACALGMGVKETTIIAPPLVLLYEMIFLRRGPLDCVRSRPVLYGGLAVTWAIPPLLAIGGAKDFNPEATLPYTLAQPRIILHYLRLALWPDPLFLYVNTHVFDVASAAEALVPGAIVVVLGLLTLWALFRRPALGFVGAWFLATIAPASSVIALTDKIQEHRMYLPLAALAVLAVLAGDFLLRTLFLRRLGRRPTAAIAAVACAALLITLGARTYVRNRDYLHEFVPVHPSDLHEAYTILVDHYLSDPALLRAEANNARGLLATPHAERRDAAFAHFVLGFADQRSDRLEDAARQFGLVVEMEPEFAYAHQQLGQVLRESGHSDAAVEHFERAVRIAPKLVYVRRDLAVALKERGDEAGARAQLAEAMRIKPNYSEPYYELGVMDADDGHADAAVAHLRQAIENRPTFAEAHFELAQLLEDRGEERRAVAHLRKAVRYGPHLVAARLKLGRMLAERGNVQAATRHLRHAARLDPGLPEVQYELAMTLARADRDDEARAHFRRAVREYRRDSAREPLDESARRDLADVQNALAMALAKRGRLDRAVYRFGRALRLRPDFAQAHTELGIVLRVRGDFEGALEQFDQAVRIDPKSAGPYKEIGIVLRERSDWEGAAEKFEQAVRLEPDFADAYNELGWIRLQQGDLGAAAKQFERALKIRPDFTEAKERLSQVRERLAEGGRRP